MQRVGAALAAQWPHRDGLNFKHRMPMEPATGDFEDYFFLSRTAVRAGLTRVAVLWTSIQFDRDDFPPPGVEIRDERTSSAGIRRSVR